MKHQPASVLYRIGYVINGAALKPGIVSRLVEDHSVQDQGVDDQGVNNQGVDDQSGRSSCPGLHQSVEQQHHYQRNHQ